MTDNEWFTVSEASEKVNIPVETLRRYIRSHHVHLRVKKIGKRYSIHNDSLNVMETIRELYSNGKNIDEVEESLSESGIPLTITVKDEHDESVTVHVADELLEIKQALDEQKQAYDEQKQFNEKLWEQLEKQHIYYEQKFEELKYDRDFVHSLKSSMEQKKLESTEEESKSREQFQVVEEQLSEIQKKQDDFEQMMKESASAQEPKKGWFSRLFGKKGHS